MNSFPQLLFVYFLPLECKTLLHFNFNYLRYAAAFYNGKLQRENERCVQGQLFVNTFPGMPLVMLIKCTVFQEFLSAKELKCWEPAKRVAKLLNRGKDWKQWRAQQLLVRGNYRELPIGARGDLAPKNNAILELDHSIVLIAFRVMVVFLYFFTNSACICFVFVEINFFFVVSRDFENEQGVIWYLFFCFRVVRFLFALMSTLFHFCYVKQGFVTHSVKKCESCLLLFCLQIPILFLTFDGSKIKT